MPLNNEIDIVTVGGVDQDVRDTYTRKAIAETEPLTVASRAYSIHEIFFSNADRKLYEAIDEITIGDTFTPGVNVEQRNLSDMMYQLFAQSPELVMNILSNYEKTATASKNYHDGDRIIWMDGVYYRVSGTVNIGTAWVVDSNIIAEENISDLITGLDQNKEDKGTVLTANLTAGETTLTFTDMAITNNCRIDVYTNVYGVNPKTMTQSNTTLTLTFKAQSVSVAVKVIIREE